MVVVTGIITAGRIIARAAPIIWRGIQRTNAGRQWISRHPKALRYGTIGATAAPVIYDLLNIDYSAIPFPKFPKTYKVRQTRNYMEQSRARRGFSEKHRPRCSCRFCRQKYQYRM